jgi:hypothetical protein
MKTVLALFLSFAALAVAQDAVAQDAIAPDSEAIKAKRVASVTWDLQTHKLVWVVQNGVQQNGEFVPSSEERYEVSPQQGAMAFEGEQRGFTVQEAAWLQQLLNILTVYCAESVVWWNAGQGEPLEEGSPAAAPPSENPHARPVERLDTAPHRVLEQQPKKAPGAILLVARNLVR